MLQKIAIPFYIVFYFVVVNDTFVNVIEVNEKSIRDGVGRVFLFFLSGE